MYGRYPTQLKAYLSQYIEGVKPYTLDLIIRTSHVVAGAKALKEPSLQTKAKKFWKELKKRIKELEELGIDEKEMEKFSKELENIKKQK